MKRKFKVTLLAFLIVLLGCFSSVFADTTSDGAEIGTANFNGTAENSAKVGDQLLHPEIGWKRYDNADKNIIFNGSWQTTSTSTLAYKSTDNWTCSDNTSITFRFYGTKIRIINNADNTTDTTKITIDGTDYTYGQKVYSLRTQLFAFQLNNLDLKVHTVVIQKLKSGSTNYSLDAIDIDSVGYLVAPVPGLATGISLDKNIYTICTGHTGNLVETITAANALNKTVNWTSSDNSVVTVDQSGKLTTLKPGTAIITVTTQDGSNLSSSCNIVVGNFDVNGDGVVDIGDFALVSAYLGSTPDKWQNYKPDVNGDGKVDEQDREGVVHAMIDSGN